MNETLRWVLVIITVIVLVVLLKWARALDVNVVVRVYDGDTIELDDGRTVRLIGVDAPEVDSPYGPEQPFGPESRHYLTKMLLNQKVRVRVGAEQEDKYGRTLGYVYMEEILVNGRIIRDGWARAYRRYPYQERELFMSYEQEARTRGLGIWQKE